MERDNTAHLKESINNWAFSGKYAGALSCKTQLFFECSRLDSQFEQHQHAQIDCSMSNSVDNVWSGSLVFYILKNSGYDNCQQPMPHVWNLYSWFVIFIWFPNVGLFFDFECSIVELGLILSDKLVLDNIYLSSLALS